MSTTLDNGRETFLRELDFRETGGIEVSLLWNAYTDAVSVHVFDAHSNEMFEARVRRERAREAFLHPYAFIHRRR